MRARGIEVAMAGTPSRTGKTNRCHSEANNARRTRDAVGKGTNRGQAGTNPPQDGTRPPQEVPLTHALASPRNALGAAVHDSLGLIGPPMNTTGQSTLRCPAQREITSAVSGSDQRARRRRKSE